MYQTKKTYLKPDMKMADLIFENSSLLLMMEHFDLDIVVRDMNVEDICRENKIDTQMFLAIANLYNGFNVPEFKTLKKEDLIRLIHFLKNSHRFYISEKIPEIQNCIKSLYAENYSREIRLIENFFADYSGEVKEHLHYEDAVAFPYFLALANDKKTIENERKKFSAAEYLDHHSDIETKLADLKELLLKHVSLKNNLPLRRKLLMGLFELEYNLTIHSLIEELILIPSAKNIERLQRVE